MIGFYVVLHVYTDYKPFGGLSNTLFWWMCGLHGRLVFSPLWVFFWVEKVGNVFILDVDVESNLMPGVHSGMLLFDAYFRNIWWLKLYLNNQFLANANICRCVLCKKHLVLCVCVCVCSFQIQMSLVKWFRGKFKFFNITGGFNTKHSCSHEALSLRPSHSISTIKLFYRSKNNVSFHTSAFFAKAFWRAIHIHF